MRPVGSVEIGALAMASWSSLALASVLATFSSEWNSSSLAVSWKAALKGSKEKWHTWRGRRGERGLDKFSWGGNTDS